MTMKKKKKKEKTATRLKRDDHLPEDPEVRPIARHINGFCSVLRLYSLIWTPDDPSCKSSLFWSSNRSGDLRNEHDISFGKVVSRRTELYKAIVNVGESAQ